MKKNSLYVVLFVLILVSCSTGKQKTVTRSDCLVFPYGTYKQNISVKFNNQTIKFKGVLQKTKISNSIYGLSPFDSTIFKIKDDKNGKVEVTIYNDRLKGKEEQIKDIYKTIGNVIDTEQCIDKNNSIVINDIKIEFNKLDKNNIPTVTKLSNKNYEVVINTVDYEI